MVAKRIHCRNFNDPRYGQVVERGDTISFPHLPNKEIELLVRKGVIKEMPKATGKSNDVKQPEKKEMN
jgi:hypothetical protein